MLSLSFIGLGIMGGPMAAHLLAAGHRLTIHTRTRAKAQLLLDRGAAWAETPADAARSADVVFICVTDTPDVEQVILGNGGIIEAARPGLIVVDHSTISPAATREFAAALSAKGAFLLDAPVSGGDVGARNATLSIMVGGDFAAFESVDTSPSPHGQDDHPLRSQRRGATDEAREPDPRQRHQPRVAEAMVFAKRNALDPQKTITAVAGGAAASWQLANLGPKMVAADFAPGFTIDLQLKDLRLVMEAAHAAGMDATAVKLVTARYAEARALGHGADGTQALVTSIQ